MSVTSSFQRGSTWKPIHPFPARMAPGLVLDMLVKIGENRRVLDPMVGSGVVVRHAIELGHEAIGFDTDPLAVLMARVWTTPISSGRLDYWTDRVIGDALATDEGSVHLDWIDADDETRAFVEYWFGKEQRDDLRRIAFVLYELGHGECREDARSLDLIRLALSRIIVTKEPCASLARDTSHSRPHKVCEASDFKVFTALERSIRFLRHRLTEQPPTGGASVELGDARSLVAVGNGTMDAVITSPPYLNAIDYLRGHRLALVWLGESLGKLRKIRSTSIGAERAPDEGGARELVARIKSVMGDVEQLPRRYCRMIERYAEDLFRMMSEIARVLRTGGSATLVVGNSCLKGTFVRNADGVTEAAKMVGLKLTGTSERVLPDRRRYLPITREGQLGRRMRTETVCAFVR
ncbi:MAG: site-specific DNA-methyltransferase [Acidobacteria bacterium]|nr:site-specific DNA-methyltransferase [Gemmatimonadota bacterium]MYF13738.1 site-specific DNA-methyltransferase [Acidobacteriota bacterium]MYI95648.1 site-specific DNA-methyltransferase [Acidobacteriota bacterium]